MSSAEITPRSEWDEMAESYGETLAPSFSPLYLKFVDHVLDQYSQKHRECAKFRILDFGCGPGQPLQAISKALLQTHQELSADCSSRDADPSLSEKKRSRFTTELKVIGIDASSEMIRKARAQISTEKSLKSLDVTLIHGDHSSLSGDVADMDVIVCSLVLMYLPDAIVNKVLHAFRQALKPDGVLLISCWSICQRVYFLNLVKSCLDHFSGSATSNHGDDPSFRFADPARLTQLLKDHGFATITHEEVSTNTTQQDVFRWIQDVPFIQQQAKQVEEWMTAFSDALSTDERNNTALIFKCQ